MGLTTERNMIASNFWHHISHRSTFTAPYVHLRNDIYDDNSIEAREKRIAFDMWTEFHTKLCYSIKLVSERQFCSMILLPCRIDDIAVGNLYGK